MQQKYGEASDKSFHLPKPVYICKMINVFLCQKLDHLRLFKVHGIVLGRGFMGKYVLSHYTAPVLCSTKQCGKCLLCQ